MTTAQLPTVVLADDDPRVLEALSSLVIAHPGLELVGVGVSGAEAAELCRRLQPTVAVVDVMMPQGGREAIAAIREVSARTSVVIYTARSDRRTRERMLEAGAALVMVKGGGTDVATEIERVALRGKILELEAAVRMSEPVEASSSPTAEELVVRYEHYLREQVGTLDLVAAHAPLDRTLDGVCSLVESTLPGSSAFVVTSDDEYPLRVFHDAPSNRQLVELVVARVVELFDDPTIESSGEDDRILIDAPGGSAAVWCSLIGGRGGRPLGALCVHREWSDVPTDRARQVIRSAARLGQVAIEHHLAERQVIGLLAAERKQIAADLHDDPVQAVTAVGLILQRLAMEVPSDQAELLEQARVTVNRAIERMRRMLFELHPVALEEDGLAVAVEVYLEETFDPLGIRWEITDALAGETDVHTDALLYRLIHESLANVAAHAHATSVRVELSSDDQWTRATIVDDGCGFDPEAVPHHRPGHLGIQTARNLAERASGRLDIRSAPGAGCTVEIWLPAVIRH